MNGIKLPVTATSSGIFVDAEGNWVRSDDIAAALNAAPKRAFEELTVEVLRETRKTSNQERSGVMIKLPVKLVDHYYLELRDAEDRPVSLWEVAKALNAAPVALDERRLSHAAPGPTDEEIATARTIYVTTGGSPEHKLEMAAQHLICCVWSRFRPAPDTPAKFSVDAIPTEALRPVLIEAIDRAKIFGVDSAVNAVKAEFARLLAKTSTVPQVSQWQPIETMPMEGFFDVWTPLGHFTRVTKEEVKENPALIRATHWKPSCAAPKAQEGAENA